MTTSELKVTVVCNFDRNTKCASCRAPAIAFVGVAGSREFSTCRRHLECNVRKVREASHA